MKIAIAGTGYIGPVLPAQHNEVVALDTIAEKIDLLNRKQSTLLSVIKLVLITVLCVAFTHIDWGHAYNIAGRKAVTEAGLSTQVLFACLPVSLPLMAARVSACLHRSFLDGNKH